MKASGTDKNILVLVYFLHYHCHAWDNSVFGMKAQQIITYFLGHGSLHDHYLSIHDFLGISVQVGKKI